MIEMLKACPFCGGGAELHHVKDNDEDFHVFVACSNCNARTSWFSRWNVETGKFKYTQRDLSVIARVAWNNGFIYFQDTSLPWCAMYPQDRRAEHEQG